jgi:hypothetical protein
MELTWYLSQLIPMQDCKTFHIFLVINFGFGLNAPKELRYSLSDPGVVGLWGSSLGGCGEKPKTF